MADQVQVEGADRLVRTLGQASDSLADLTAANSEVARVVAARAASIAPRVTGRLAGSTSYQGTPTQARVTAGMVYAGPIHYGWHARHITPQPWISEAFEAQSETTERIYLGQLDQVLATVKGV